MIAAVAILIATSLGSMLAGPQTTDPASSREPVRSAPTVEDLVARAEREWGTLRIALDARMHCAFDDGDRQTTELSILRDGSDRTRIEFHSPPRDEGKVLLRIDDDVWAYLPRPDKLLRLPPRRSPLPGQGYVEALLPAEAERVGARVEETGDGPMMILAGPDGSKAGDRIVYDAATRLPVRREFVSGRGRTLQTLSVEATRTWEGRPIPWVVRFVDSTGRGRDCTLEVDRAESLPADVDRLFDRDALSGKGGR